MSAKRCVAWQAAALGLLLAGCASIPVQPLIVEQGYVARTLDPQAITVRSWNIKKGEAAHWAEGLRSGALKQSLLEADLLLLQEACVARDSGPPELAALWRGEGYGWRFAASFVSAALGCGADIATGVLTASRAAPLDSTALRSAAREFGITPKTALATVYDLRGRDARLLVVNAHLLNFEVLGAEGFAAQLRQIGRRIAAHPGPVILAGDFNTRDQQRMDLLNQTATEQGLTYVFGRAPAGRTEAVFSGGYALDHILYRGLVLKAPGRIGAESPAGYSDHNSLTVTLAMPEES